MQKRIAVIVTLFIPLIMLSGCATTRKQNDLQKQGLRNQIQALEAQIRTKDEEINSLRDELSRGQESKEVVLVKEAGKKQFIGEVKSRPTLKHVQAALKNAGYNPGAIDGKMGKQTRDAVRAFQRANNLAVDGKVGKQTWSLLKEYLYKKVK